jgi:AcrR family transcriptional regulator
MSGINTALTHRQRQALATRRLIVDAATELFLEGGYASTTIEAIAAGAGVAVSTVYGAFTNKRGILKAIRETWHQASGQRELFAQASAEPDLTRRLERAAHATRRQWETSARMMAVYTAAAAADPEAAAELAGALTGRRTNLGRILQSWAADAGLDPERTAALFLTLTRAEVYLELVEEWHWTPQQYEDWLAGTLKAQLQG